jgi:Na+-transporting NADH:ubiquinone oxidoreductase subunit NqrB
MPRALTRHDLWRGLQGLQTGSFIFQTMFDGIDSKDQAAYFFEQIALISTLLLTVVYPSYQEAMSYAKVVEVQHAGLGLAWATVTTLGVHGCCM